MFIWAKGLRKRFWLLWKRLKLNGMILAIDYGRKRVGIATGDAEIGIAFPRTVILNRGIPNLVVEINNLCEELGVSSVVVGLPLNGDGMDENEVMTDVRVFVDELKKNMNGVDVELLDERFSSFEADQLMNEAAEVSAGKTLGRDAYAAQVILRRFFDKSAS